MIVKGPLRIRRSGALSQQPLRFPAQNRCTVPLNRTNPAEVTTTAPSGQRPQIPHYYCFDRDAAAKGTPDLAPRPSNSS